MAQAKDFSEPVQLLAFILSPDCAWQPRLLERLEQKWGALRHCGTCHPFEKTGYYNTEMGATLYRGLVAFQTLTTPEQIGAYKQQSNALEQEWSGNQTLRNVNIDIGYMDVDKLVLPSYKRGPYKLYAGEGLWLDMQMTYAKGEFHPTHWAFEDLRRNPYRKDLLLIREKYKKALKEIREKTSP